MCEIFNTNTNNCAVSKIEKLNLGTFITNINKLDMVDVQREMPTMYNTRNIDWIHMWVLSWPVGSVSASHQCGPGSIPCWGSGSGAVSEKGLSSLV